MGGDKREKRERFVDHCQNFVHSRYLLPQPVVVHHVSAVRVGVLVFTGDLHAPHRFHLFSFSALRQNIRVFHLLLRHGDVLLENGPDDRLKEGGCGQGSLIVVEGAVL